jgi:hypothetical protein
MTEKGRTLNAVFEPEVLQDGAIIHVLRAKARAAKVIVRTNWDVLGGVIHACKAWGRSQVWIQTNTDRYGNEDGWPQSIAGRADQAIQAGTVFGSREREGMQGDALAVSQASSGMPEFPYRVLWMHYVLVKARQYHIEEQPDPNDPSLFYRDDGKVYSVPRIKKVRVWGNWYKMPVAAKAKELGIGTNDYYKHLNGAHMWIGARLGGLCARNSSLE